MKATWMMSAAAALAVAAVPASFVQADVRPPAVRYDHDYRYRAEHSRDFDESIDIREVPREVMRAVDKERRGRRIESVQYVHRDDKFFYRFRIDDPHPRDRDMSIRITPDGRILSVEEAQRYDHSYRR